MGRAYRHGAIDPHVENGTLLRPPSPEFKKLEAKPLNFSSDNVFQRSVHVQSRPPTRTKKCGGHPHISTRRRAAQSVIYRMARTIAT